MNSKRSIQSRCKMYYKVKNLSSPAFYTESQDNVTASHAKLKYFYSVIHLYGYVELNDFSCLSFSNKFACLLSLVIHYFNSELEFQATSLKLAKWTTAGQSDCSMPKVYLIWKEPAAVPGIKLCSSSRTVL